MRSEAKSPLSSMVIRGSRRGLGASAVDAALLQEPVEERLVWVVSCGEDVVRRLPQGHHVSLGAASMLPRWRPIVVRAKETSPAVCRGMRGT